MRQGSVYGVIVIPFGYMRDKLTGRGSSVVLCTDENRFAVGGTFEEELAAVMTALGNEQILMKLMQSGVTETGAHRVLDTVHSDFYRLGNMGEFPDFSFFFPDTWLNHDWRHFWLHFRHFAGNME